jgi:hypothetical protein
MAAGTVIELDLDPAESTGEPGLPPRWRRGLLACGVLVVCATTLVAARPWDAPRLTEIATLDTETIMSERVSGDSMYAILAGLHPSLAAYRLDDGTRRWSIPLPVPDSAALVEVAQPVAPAGATGDGAAATVLVSSLDPTLTDNRTAAVDGATGATLWRSPLFRVTQVNPGSGVLLAANLTTGAGLERRYRDVDPRTGAGRWAYDVPAGWTTALPDEPPGSDRERYLVAVATADIQAAAPQAAGAPPDAAPPDAAPPDAAPPDAAPPDAAPPAAPPDGSPAGGGPAARTAAGPADPGPSLMVRGDVLLVGYQRDGQALLAGYRIGDLAPLWTDKVRSLSVRVDLCGDLLCLSESGQLRAVRPDTGAAPWSGAGSPGITGTVQRWIYTVSDLAASYGLWPGPARLVDPATGRTALDLGGWRLVSQPDPAGRPALFELIEHGTGRIWLGLLEAGPRVQPLGTVSDLPSGTCDAGPTHIVCLTTGQQLRIWRYRA